MWEFKAFDDLSVDELHAIYELRVRVFVVEQACSYQEVDQADKKSWHGMFWQEDQLHSYFRLIPEEDGIHLGRVVVAESARRNGLGRSLVEEAIKKTSQLYPDCNLYIQAQAYLKAFYADFGFESISDTYLEDGIPHLDMVLSKEKIKGY